MAKAKTVNGKMMPHNIEAEQSVLGCALIDSNAAAGILGEIVADDFLQPLPQTVLGTDMVQGVVDLAQGFCLQGVEFHGLNIGLLGGLLCMCFTNM